jgi:hypothetical protein
LTRGKELNYRKQKITDYEHPIPVKSAPIVQILDTLSSISIMLQPSLQQYQRLCDTT